MPHQDQSINDPAAVMHVPEPMVMHRSDESSQGSLSSTNSGSKPSKGVNSKRPAHHSTNYSHDSSSGASTDSNHNAPQRRHDQHHAPSQPVLESDENSSASLLTAPLAWVQKSRERRRRLLLQQQAEEQLRKIAEAERLNPHHGLSITTTSGHCAHNSGYNMGDDHADDEFRVGTQHLSKSGEGMTAELDFDFEDDDEDEFLVPKVRIHPEPRLLKAESNDSVDDSPNKADFKAPAYILTPEQMHHIAKYVLPRTIAYCQWRRLYSLSRDGDSFDGCLRIISEVARTLMVVRTTRGAVFGGYADSPWGPQELGNARFYGSAQACLFSVKDPEKTHEGLKSPKNNLLNVYHWTGKNRYIQLCDTSSKMLAFGGGGSDGAFGLCVQEDFQSGSTGPCDTFDNAPLCDQETFEIVDVEFWEFLTGVF